MVHIPRKPYLRKRSQARKFDSGGSSSIVSESWSVQFVCSELFHAEVGLCCQEKKRVLPVLRRIFRIFHGIAKFQNLYVLFDDFSRSFANRRNISHFRTSKQLAPVPLCGWLRAYSRCTVA